ncbi:unnamed protein product [Peniophora sp. CBMAI 1063]|nr:unnamed protein product [Peniophora sp. CBMAI 1063]
MISPLADLGLLQAKEIRKMGLTAATLDQDSLSRSQGDPLKEAKECKHSVIIATPERVQTPAFNSLLRIRAKTKLANMIFAYFIDEAHAFVEWGQTWRPAYKAVMRVVSLLRANIPIVAMTATLSTENERKLVKELNFRTGQWDLIRRPTTKPNVRTIYLPLTHGLGGKTFPDIAWVVARRQKVIIYVSTITQCNELAFYLYKFFPEGRDARLGPVRVYNAFQSSATNLDNLIAFLNDPNTFIIIATIKLGLGADTNGVVTVVTLGAPQTIEEDEQQRGRAGRGGEIEAESYTYVQQGFVQAVRDAAKDDPNTRASTGRKQRAGAGARKEKSVVVEGKKQTRALDGYCGGLVRTVTALTKNTCLDGELDVVFANPGPLSGSHCFHQQRRFPCSSCMWRLNEARMAQGLLLAPPPEPTPPASGEQSHAADCRPRPADANLPEDGAAEAQAAPAEKQRATTKVMRSRVERALSTFCDNARAELPDPSDPAQANLPTSFFIPHDLRVSLLDAFSAARDRAAFDQIFQSWAHLATHGDALYRIVVALNAAFDKYSDMIKAEGNATRAATVKAKKAAANVVAEPEEKLLIRIPPLSRVRACAARSSVEISNTKTVPQTPSKNGSQRGSLSPSSSSAGGTPRKRRPSIDENVNASPSKRARLYMSVSGRGQFLSPTASPSRKRQSEFDEDIDITPTKRRRAARSRAEPPPLPAPRFG